MIIFIDTFLIIGILALLFGAGALILDNILSILLVILLIIVFIVLLLKWPKVTLIILICLALISGFIVFGYEANETNNIPVTIYVATGECNVCDKDSNVEIIPKGAVIARYTDVRERQIEGNYFGFSEVCVWYHEGDTSQCSVSNVNSSTWRVKEIEEITYREFKKGAWKIR